MRYREVFCIMCQYYYWFVFARPNQGVYEGLNLLQVKEYLLLRLALYKVFCSILKLEIRKTNATTQHQLYLVHCTTLKSAFRRTK